MAGRYLSSKNHRPPGTARAANSFKSRSLASWPLCLPAPFGELFGCSAKGKAIATRAALTGCRGPARLPLRFCASCCLPCFAFLALPGLFPGLLTCTRYICPAACLCAFSESLCGLPLLPFSIRAAACRSASALPSMAARLCLPKEVRPAGFLPWFASLLRCLLWPCRGFPAYGLKTKAARLCSASLPCPEEGCGSASLCLRCFALRLSKNVGPVCIYRGFRLSRAAPVAALGRPASAGLRLPYLRPPFFSAAFRAASPAFLSASACASALAFASACRAASSAAAFLRLCASALLIFCNLPPSAFS